MIWIILAAGFVLRLINLNQSLWLDEGINVMAARSFSFFGMITQYAVADFHPPGWFVILWIWGKIFGYSEVAVRMPSVFFGVITIYFTYLLGKKLISQKAGLLAALLLAVNPLHIYYSQEARMYALACLAVAINMFLLIKIIKGEKVHIIFLTLSNLGILLSDYVSYFIFPAQLLFLLFLKKKTLFIKWVKGIIGALVLFAVWLPVLLNQLNIGASASANLPTWKFVNGGFDFKTLPLTFVKIIIGRISLANKLLYIAVLLPVISIFSFLLWRGIRQLDITKKILLCWVFVPLLVATTVSLVIPVFSYFRVLYIIPGFLILLVIGILSFGKRLGYIFLVFVITIELFCSLVYLLFSANQREDWKGLVAHFKEIRPEIILLESSGTFPAFEYYSGGTLNAKGALKDFPAKDENSVADLNNMLKNNENVYLVDYLVQISDPKRLVARRLTELGYKEVNTRDFHGVGFVYHYLKR